jgi:hypothetical protein
MIIDKEIISQIYRPYFFVTGIFDIDAKYFKKRIDEGVQNSSLNYKTQVVGQQTDWKFFNKDENFGIFLFQLLDYLERLNLELGSFSLGESWGLIEKLGDYTKKHSHSPTHPASFFSGALYLNDHHQKLYFPEINQEITPQKGRAVLFSSFLKHYTKRNATHKEKYAISFNFHGQGFEK